MKKLYYLKSVLEGEAANLLIDTPLTEAAYAEAWRELKGNYEN